MFVVRTNNSKQSSKSLSGLISAASYLCIMAAVLLSKNCNILHLIGGACRKGIATHLGHLDRDYQTHSRNREVQGIDLRSDTVTRPTPEMYQAMTKASVGDDVMLEDPTILSLQRRCAEMFNKEDALFVPTGTMGNLVSLMVHCAERGKEVIMGKQNHIFLYEGGGLAQIGGIQINTVMNNEDGTIDLSDVIENIRNEHDDHMPVSRVICLENTQNRCGGLIIPETHFHEVRKLADENGMAVHLDGARILHACLATNLPPTAYTDSVDSINMCFSKGLGAPIGSIIAGTALFCRRARKIRKALGGGLRQAGVLAAAAHYALDNNVQLLAQDHKNAQAIAQVVAAAGGEMASVDLDKVHTNIVYIKLKKLNKMDAHQFVERLNQVPAAERKALGISIAVQMLPFSRSDARFVCHLNITKEDIELACKKLQYVLEEMNQSVSIA